MKLPSAVAAACLCTLGDLASASLTLRGRDAARGAVTDPELSQLVQLAAHEDDSQIPPSMTSGLEKIMMRVETDPASLGGVAGIVKPMVEKLLGQVTNSHESSKKALDSAIDDIKKCKTGRHKKGDKDTTSLEAQFDKVKKKAGDCKSGEQSAKAEAGTCDQTADIMKTTIKAKCKKLKMKPPPTAAGDTCSVGPADDLETWLDRMATSWEAQYKEHLKLQWECGNMTDKAKKQGSDCAKTKAKASNTGAKCDGLDDEMKQAVCGLKQGLELGCTDYEGCYKRQVEDYRKLVTTTEVEVKTRKSQWRMLKRLLCLVNAYDFKSGKVDKTKMEACSRKGRYATDNLEMTYPDVPDKKTCKAELPAGVDPKIAASCAKR